MMWFYNLKISSKLLLSFMTVLFLMLILGAAALFNMGRMQDRTLDLSTNWLPSVRAIMVYKSHLLELRRFELTYYIADSSDRNTYTALMNKAFDDLKKDDAFYATQISEEEERRLYPLFQKNMASYTRQHESFIHLINTQDDAKAKAFIAGEFRQTFNLLLEQLDQLTQINLQGATKSTELARLTYQSAMTWTIALLVAAFILGTLLALWIAKLISTPLSLAVHVAQKVAQGDLTADIQSHTTDETGQLMRALKTMNSNLQAIVGQVRTSTDDIAVSCREIATGNMDLSNRTESQASALEETASSMEELTSTVRTNMEHARSANDLAQKASQTATQGGMVVSKVVTTMASIQGSSRKIADILGVIDSIAFQTNILALNAAVEAARAGEQGRGFAVVATEVRNLAHRSASAAREIKTLIENSVTQVELGHTLVGEAGETMKAIVSSITHVSTIMSDIVLSTTEQTQGIEQINEAVSQMDSVTQQNAALVEEAAAASSSMQLQAEALTEAVSVFKLPH